MVELDKAKHELSCATVGYYNAQQDATQILMDLGVTKSKTTRTADSITHHRIDHKVKASPMMKTLLGFKDELVIAHVKKSLSFGGSTKKNSEKRISEFLVSLGYRERSTTIKITKPKKGQPSFTKKAKPMKVTKSDCGEYLQHKNANGVVTVYRMVIVND